jgi:hypothetical protein
MLAQSGNEWEASAARPHEQFLRFPQQCFESHNYQGFCVMRARFACPSSSNLRASSIPISP